jgi:hypothetical protein
VRIDKPRGARHLTGIHARLRELRPYLRAALAAGGADEVLLDVRQPDVIGTAVGADLDVVTARVIAAIDQNVAHAGRHISPKVILAGRSSGLNFPQNSMGLYMSLAVDCAKRIATQM